MTAVKVFTAGGWRELGYVAPSSVPIEAWHVVGAAGEPAFTNGWINDVASADPLQFRKEPDGRVYLRGTISTGTTGTTAFTLPAGYLPLRTQLFDSLLSASTPGGYVTVEATGAVKPIRGAAAVIYVDLSFATAQATFPTGPAAPEAFAPRVTSLPASPVDGQEIVYVADAANGVLWRLRYNAGSASAYKWEFVGGSGLYNEQVAQQSTASATYVDLSGGPQVTVPLAGEFEISFDAMLWNTNASFYAIMAPKLGSAATADDDSALAQMGSATATVSVGGSIRRTLAAAGSLVKMQYRQANGGTAAAQRRRMRITPVRVG